MTLNNQEFPIIHNSLSLSEENLTPNEEGIINTPMKTSILFSPIRLMNNRRKSKSINKICIQKEKKTNIIKEQTNEKDKNKNNIKNKENSCIKGNTNISNEIKHKEQKQMNDNESKDKNNIKEILHDTNKKKTNNNNTVKNNNNKEKLKKDKCKSKHIITGYKSARDHLYKKNNEIMNPFKFACDEIKKRNKSSHRYKKIKKKNKDDDEEICNFDIKKEETPININFNLNTISKNNYEEKIIKETKNKKQNSINNYDTLKEFDLSNAGTQELIDENIINNKKRDDEINENIFLYEPETNEQISNLKIGLLKTKATSNPEILLIVDASEDMEKYIDPLLNNLLYNSLKKLGYNDKEKIHLLSFNSEDIDERHFQFCKLEKIKIFTEGKRTLGDLFDYILKILKNGKGKNFRILYFFSGRVEWGIELYNGLKLFSINKEYIGINSHIIKYIINEKSIFYEQDEILFNFIKNFSNKTNEISTFYANNIDENINKIFEMFQNEDYCV